MSKVIDILGQRFGRLQVIGRANNTKDGSAQWVCQCDCGNQKIIAGASLRRGLSTSCGCYGLEVKKANREKQTIDETGNQYGYLTVIDKNTDSSQQKDGRAMWNCQCKCGNICVVSGKLLRAGKVTSCGCRIQSLGEETIEILLIKNNINYSKEYTVIIPSDLQNTNHKYRFDFAIFSETNQLLYFIEFDGEQHFPENKTVNSNGWGHRIETYEKTHIRDTIKNQWCKENNISLIRIPYTHLKDLCIEDLLLETSQFVV